MLCLHRFLSSSYLLILLFVLGACGHIDRSARQQDVVQPSVVDLSPAESSVGAAKPLAPVTKAPYVAKYGEIAESYNSQVRKWVSYFKGRGRRHMKRYLSRSTRYLPMMQRKLRDEGLPEDLIYIVFVESGFQSLAHSRANAVGYWQFIRDTGRRYGLKVNGHVDERRDPVLSTEAAARYFNALYNLFGDWYLAMASYNTGENRVRRAVMRYGTRDFWKLSRRRRLHRETRNYVPKFLAVRMIAKDPERFGFTNVNYEPPLSYDTYRLDQSISLKKLSAKLGVSYKVLKRLNPRYRTEYVPVYRNLQRIRLPKGFHSRAMAAIAQSRMAAPKYIVRDFRYYRVRRGDTLSGIAQRFRTRVSNIRRLNRLKRRSFIRVGQRLKVPERYGHSVAVKSASRKARGKVKRTPNNITFYRVKKGDNLSTIAQRHRVTVRQLYKWNNFKRRSYIRVGQKIRVKPGLNNNRRIHVVRRGDNLSTIARRYRTTIHKIASANALVNRSKLMVGLKLIIP